MPRRRGTHGAPSFSVLVDQAAALIGAAQVGTSLARIGRGPTSSLFSWLGEYTRGTASMSTPRADYLTVTTREKPETP